MAIAWLVEWKCCLAVKFDSIIHTICGLLLFDEPMPIGNVEVDRRGRFKGSGPRKGLALELVA